ncbi:hypothetical protein BDV11DRAFT_194603 [Aspergillus similis]
MLPMHLYFATRFSRFSTALVRSRSGKNNASTVQIQNSRRQNRRKYSTPSLDEPIVLP